MMNGGCDVHVCHLQCVGECINLKACLCVSVGEYVSTRLLPSHCICVCMQIRELSAFAAHICIRLHIHVAALHSTVRRHIENFTPSLRNCIFFSSLCSSVKQTGLWCSSERPWMLNTSYERKAVERRRRRAGDKKRTGIEKARERVRSSKKWQMKDQRQAGGRIQEVESEKWDGET